MPTATTQQLVQPTTTIPGLTPGGVTTQGSGAVIDGIKQAQYQTVDGVYREVQANETVQGQLKGILADDSPLMQQARAKALEGMQERGLLNSAMAQSAGQAAVIDKALQIATPDAATYSQAARDNQTIGNETNRFNADQFGKSSQFNAGEGNKLTLQKTADAAAMDRQKVADAANMERTKLTNQTNMAVAEMNKQATIAQATMSANAQLESARINAEANYAVQEMSRQYAMEAATNQQAAGMMNDFIRDTMTIQTNPDLDYAAREALLRDRANTTNQGLMLINAGSQIWAPAAVAPPPPPPPPTAAPVAAPPPFGGQVRQPAYDPWTQFQNNS